MREGKSVGGSISLPCQHVAAICVYPELVSVVKEKLENPLVSIASVGGGFPASQTFTNIKVMEIEQAIEQGAEEIDMVLPVGKFLMDDLEYVEYEIQVIKQRMGSVHLKVILETGSLKDFSLIRKASLLAIGAGADFIKTSTGKISPGCHSRSHGRDVQCHQGLLQPHRKKNWNQTCRGHF